MTGTEQPFWSVSHTQSTPVPAQTVKPTTGWVSPTRRPVGEDVLTPTPDAARTLPALRTQTEMHSVYAGETLAQIANRYGVSVNKIAEANQLTNPDILEIGQQLTIPAPQPQGTGSAFKIIPDSELVFGPANMNLDIDVFIQAQGGYLANYWEEVNEKSLSGAQIIDLVSRDYSVNPRLLLAVLQHQSGWVTRKDLTKTAKDYPLGLRDPQRKGLYLQLTWTANNLNRGYYLWRVNGIATWLLSDETLLLISPEINAGTAAVQQFFALLQDWAGWEKAVSPQGLFATYQELFGYPFDYAIEPLLPPDLAQPELLLPFEPGKEWAFTSGPHGGWGDGAAWAALDFAPPGDSVGCVTSDDWVTAVAGGLILRADNGAVIQDLDGDGFEQTGWVILYMHVEARDRVESGTYLKAGEHIGHPSCEGGFSTGTHVHLARRYNGEWIAADQGIPFNLGGWISSGTGKAYDGYLSKGKKSIEAYAGRSPDNVLQH